MVSSRALEDVSDGQIADQIASGVDAQGAETALYSRFARRIQLYGIRHLGDDQSAADLVQQVFVSVLQALRAGRVESPESLGAFVLGTCRHIVWDMRRAEQRQRKIAAECADLEATTTSPSLSESDFAQLYQCMQKLPERDNQVVRWTYLEDRSSDDIAARLGLTTGNVRVLRHRALARLYVCMEGGTG
jgi:RNA polymerase sigma-70 factor (ECF subfamily)